MNLIFPDHLKDEVEALLDLAISNIDQTNMAKEEKELLDWIKEENHIPGQDDFEKQVHACLEEPYWLPELKTGRVYERTHDDTDGDNTQRLSVIIGVDGDMHINTFKGEDLLGYLRFRTYMGGGHSLRVRNALFMLAEAIRLDNEERPLNDPQE